MSGGVVFALPSGTLPNTITGGLGKWSPRFDVAGAVPPGTWVLAQTGTLNSQGHTVTVPIGAMIESDGYSLISTGHGFILGDRRKPDWPWMRPFPYGFSIPHPT